MRKFIILLPLIVLLLGFTSKCANQADIQNLQSAYQAKFGYSLNANNAAQIIDKWQNTSSVYCFILYSENQYHPNEMPYSYSRVILANAYSDTGTAYSFSTGVATQDFGASTSTTLNWNASGSSTWNKSRTLFVGSWSDFHTVPIEWDSPQYNPNMPIPEMSTNYGEISVNSSSPEIPFDINFVNPNNEYYIEIYCDYWIPDNMAIQINRNFANNDGFVYKALSKDLVSGYLIDPEQMLRIQGINNLKLQLQTDWENALTQVPVSSLEYANPNSLPTGMFNQYKSTYENYCRNILGFYGSQFTIMMRYFTIVNDTQYVVGAWRTWTTYSPNEFTERLPDYYVPYVPASGQENITNNIDPENVEIVQGTGSNTGAISDPNYYITVNQNTPNYPDYPTIASYNKDNLLLDTMNHINSLSTFFGEFGSFLTTSFAFFPAWIWAIIGAGFGISIVVMFLKIL